MPSQMSGKDVRDIAVKLGRKFVRITNVFHEIPNNPGKRDPKTVYLLDTGHKLRVISETSVECIAAKLYWAGRAMSINDWSEVTKASITKYLEDDGTDSDCAVCYDDLPLRESLNCTSCNSKICGCCMFRLGLTDENIERIMNGHWIVGHRCPLCRTACKYDVRRHWFRVMDRMDDFTDAQREALLFAKDNDFKADVHTKNYMEEHPLKQYRKNVSVVLHGLKGKTKWNGKRAWITGDGVVKNGIYRLPVQLRGKKKEKGLIKQTNMKIVK